MARLKRQLGSQSKYACSCRCYPIGVKITPISQPFASLVVADLPPNAGDKKRVMQRPQTRINTPRRNRSAWCVGNRPTYGEGLASHNCPCKPTPSPHPGTNGMNAHLPGPHPRPRICRLNSLGHRNLLPGLISPYDVPSSIRHPHPTTEAECVYFCMV